MEETPKRREPEKIRMPPLVDRYKEYDRLYGEQTENTTNENHNENDSQSVSELKIQNNH